MIVAEKEVSLPCAGEVYNRGSPANKRLRRVTK